MQSKLRRSLSACLALGFSVTAGCATYGSAQTPELPPSEHGVTEFSLDNGMKVLVKEDHRAPISVVQLWYRVGSNDEPSGLTGISHALEHMLFKGTPRYPAEQLTRTIQREGGRYNAFTGSDYTAYYEIFEKSRMPISFDIESDRMVNVVLREEDFVKEIEVVKEERRLRVDDRPERQLYELLYATAFHNSPSRQPVIGWMDDLNHMTLDDLKDWYRRWYAPNNAVLMVAGSVQPEEVQRLAMRYMAPLKSVSLPTRKPQREAQQQGERHATLKRPAKRPQFIIGYRAPAVGQASEDWEPYALVALKAVLSSGEDARFAKRLVRGKKIAQRANAYYSLYSRHDDLFVISAEPVKGVDVKTLQAAIEGEIEALKREGIQTDELERVIAKVYADEIYSRDSVARQAYQLAALETIGVGWRAAYQFSERIRQVTAQQVQAVAQKYLVKDQRTVVVLEPQALDSPRPANQQVSAP